MPVSKRFPISSSCNQLSRGSGRTHQQASIYQSIYLCAMIFGQGDRFIHQNVHPNGELMAIDQKHETDSVVGPGAYYDARRESKRSGWKKDVASRIQPMAGHASPQRHNHQNGSILLPTGLLVAAPSSDIDASPGPGHYNVNKSTLKISSKTSTPVRQQFLSRPGSAQGSPNKTGTSSPGGGLSQTYNGSMGASPRMAHTLTALNNGLLVMGDGRSQESASPGPGYYLSPVR